MNKTEKMRDGWKDYLIVMKPETYNEVKRVATILSEPVAVIIRRAITEYLRHFKMDRSNDEAANAHK